MCPRRRPLCGAPDALCAGQAVSDAIQTLWGGVGQCGPGVDLSLSQLIERRKNKIEEPLKDQLSDKNFKLHKRKILPITGVKLRAFLLSYIPSLYIYRVHKKMYTHLSSSRY